MAVMKHAGRREDMMASGKGRAMGDAAKERGICILCGQETVGAPAKPDIVIIIARKIRSFLKMPKKHTLACKECFEECVRKGEAFDKKRKGYLAGAVLFFFLLLLGSAAFGGFDLRLLLPAAIGAAIIAVLPYASYFPSFGN